MDEVILWAEKLPGGCVFSEGTSEHALSYWYSTIRKQNLFKQVQSEIGTAFEKNRKR